MEYRRIFEKCLWGFEIKAGEGLNSRKYVGMGIGLRVWMMVRMEMKNRIGNCDDLFYGYRNIHSISNSEQLDSGKI